MKRNPIWIPVLAAALFVCAPSASGYDDLLTRKKSDSSIKGLVFPKSMKVLESRPEQGSYFYYGADGQKFDEGVAESAEAGALDAVLGDPKAVSATLIKTDPVRINPASLGEDVRGPVTRAVLKDLAKKFDEDLLLVFRREVRTDAGKWTLKTRGLVYLAKQNRLLALPANEQTADADGAPAREDAGELARKGLKALAAAAKKEILDKKFEVRRSAY